MFLLELDKIQVKAALLQLAALFSLINYLCDEEKTWHVITGCWVYLAGKAPKKYHKKILGTFHLKPPPNKKKQLWKNIHTPLTFKLFHFPTTNILIVKHFWLITGWKVWHAYIYIYIYLLTLEYKVIHSTAFKSLQMS